MIPSKIPPSVSIFEDEIEFATTKYEIMAVVELQNIIHSTLRSPPLEIIVLQSKSIEKPSIELKFETSEESSGSNFEVVFHMELITFRFPENLEIKCYR